MQHKKIPNSIQSSISQYGSWAIVTGASSGIGKALAIHIAGCGVNVVLNARSEDTLQRFAADLEKTFGVKCIVVASDLSIEKGIKALTDATQDLDIGLMVASAGFGTSGSFVHSSIKDEHDMLKVNCEALLLLTHAYANKFIHRKKGGIILLSSIISFQGAPYATHYAATKAYVQTLAEGLYHELRPKGVDVLAAAPGPVHTGFAARAKMQMDLALRPEDIALPILKALGKQSTVIPGGLSKLLAYSISIVPRSWQVKIMRMVMKKMTV